MSTRLSGVTIPVSLDTSKALQQLDSLERKLDKEQASAEKVNKTAKNAVANTSVAKKMGAGSEMGGAAGSAVRDVAAKGAAAKLAGLAPRTPFGPIAAGAAGLGSRLLPQAAMGAAKFAGITALGFAAASSAAQNAPTIAYALEKIAGLEGRLQGLQIGLEGLRRGFSTFESGITAIPKAVGETKDLAELSFRLGGSVPNVNTLFRQAHLANVYQTEIDKKFNQFKDKEVFAGAGDDFRKYVERSVDVIQKSFGMKGNN